MKTLYTLLGILFSIALFAQPKEVNQNGYNVFYFPNGKKSSEGNFENGKPEGYWKTYFESGILKSEGNRENHLLDSLWKFYREDGALEKMITFAKGKKNGLTYLFNEEGLLIAKEPYKDDLKDGLGLYFYAEEQSLKFERPFIKNKLQGIGYEYSKNGKLISIITYDKGFLKSKESINRMNPQGQKAGIWIEFYEERNDEGLFVKRLEGRYKRNLKNGYFREYDRKGVLLGATKYLNGKIIENAQELQNVEIEREYYPNAKVKWEKTFIGGTPHGIWKEYSDTGSVVNSQIYENGRLLGEGVIDESGKKQGPWKEYYSDGELRAEGEYKDGARFNKWKFYHLNGKLEQTGKYVSEGRPHGLWVWYYPNGEVLREENFRKGNEDGDIVEYDTAGNEVLRGQYLDGLEDGEWFLQIGEYREEGSFVDGLRHGVWVHHYTSNGKKSFEGDFIEGEANGKHVYYYDNGRKMLEGKYEFGLKQGDWKRFDRDGLILLTIRYKDGHDVKIQGKKVKPSQEEIENSWDSSESEESSSEIEN